MRMVRASIAEANMNMFAIEKFINVIRCINAGCANYGKDGKFQLFVCLACRYVWCKKVCLVLYNLFI